jgi:hypothetical protein
MHAATSRLQTISERLCWVQVKYYNNLQSQPVSGIDAGHTLHIGTPQGMHATLSYTAVDSMLRALEWWRNAYSGSSDNSALYRHAAAADAAKVLTQVHNMTEETLQMWMDLGDKTTVADLPAGVQRLMQPLVRPVPRPTAADLHHPSQPPAILLCITLQTLSLQVLPPCLKLQPCLISLLF